MSTMMQIINDTFGSSSNKTTTTNNTTNGGAKPSTDDDPFSFMDVIFGKAKDLSTSAQSAAKVVSDEIKDKMLQTADTLGLKDQIEAMNSAVRKLDKDAKIARNKALAKARRFAKRALDFDEDDAELDSADYDSLLSAAGATEIQVANRKNNITTYEVPAGQIFVCKARVKSEDIGFAVKARDLADAKKLIAVQPLTMYTSKDLIQFQLPAVEQQRTVKLVFDNKNSQMNIARVTYWVAIGENVSLADEKVSAQRMKEVNAADNGP